MNPPRAFKTIRQRAVRPALARARARLESYDRTDTLARRAAGARVRTPFPFADFDRGLELLAHTAPFVLVVFPARETQFPFPKHHSYPAKKIRKIPPRRPPSLVPEAVSLLPVSHGQKGINRAPGPGKPNSPSAPPETCRLCLSCV